MMSGCSARATERLVLSLHPCFSDGAEHAGGRIHLPVAPACNVQCAYCDRTCDCVNESRPGLSSRVLSPEEALERLEVSLERGATITTIGIAGPGDPLANEETFRTIGLVRQRFPDRILCVSTNGLALAELVPRLVAGGVRSVSVTISAVMPETAAEIYLWVTGPDGQRIRGIEAGRYLIDRQWEGVRRAAAAGLVVKVNSVLIPGVNDVELPLVAHLAAEWGAQRHNILPLIPLNRFSGWRTPTHAEIEKAREACSAYLAQMTHCTHCRADACGLLGEDRDMEAEALLARLGEDYIEVVS